MVGQDGVTLVRPQAIAVVRKADGIHIPADWQGAWGVCPLPDLLGTGDMWVADFRIVTNVDRSYLRKDKRVRSLSETGWAVFRQRLIAATTRAVVAIEDLRHAGAAAWAETAMETLWVAAGRSAATFQAWLNTNDPLIEWPSRRHALEAGMAELVGRSLDAELSRETPR
jgi:hypothetical protein